MYIILCLTYNNTQLGLDAAQNKIDKQKQLLHEERRRRHELVRASAEKNNKYKKDKQYMLNFMDALATDLKRTKREAKEAVRLNEQNKSLANRRLVLLKDLKVKVGVLKDDLADESKHRVLFEHMSNMRLKIKREKTLGRHGGSGNDPAMLCY